MAMRLGGMLFMSVGRESSITMGQSLGGSWIWRKCSMM